MSTLTSFDHVYTTISVVRKNRFCCSLYYALNVKLEKATEGIKDWSNSMMCPARSLILDKGVSFRQITKNSFHISKIVSNTRGCGNNVRFEEIEETETAQKILDAEKGRWPLNARIVLRLIVNRRIKQMLRNNQRTCQGTFMGCSYTIALPCLDDLFGKRGDVS